LPTTQRFAERNHVFDRVSSAFIERDHFGVRPANLQIQLRTSDVEKTLLRTIHETTRKASPSKPRKHSQVIDPAPNTVETRQHGTGDTSFEDADEKEIRLD
jgi:hypothetical protein